MEKKYFNQKIFKDSRKAREISDLEYLNSIISKYSYLDFVKRIIDPKDRIEMPSGRSGTHYMTVSPLYGQYVAFPRIIRTGDKSLKLLGEQEALIHARNTGELIPFKSKAEADWFAFHYKDIWKGKYQPDGISMRKHGKFNH